MSVPARPAASHWLSITLMFVAFLVSGTAVADVVTITEAKYQAGKDQLRVRATSSEQPNAALTVVGWDSMRYRSRKNYYQFKLRPVAPLTPPSTVTVVSSLGGTAVASVSGAPQPTPPGPAANPSPASGANAVSVNVVLSWSGGSDRQSSDVYFGTNPSPGAAEFQGNQSTTSFVPGTLANSSTYYWRVDEVNTDGTTVGSVWSFSTEAAPSPPGQAAGPMPSSGATGVSLSTVLGWTPGADADSHEVYFGTNPSPAAGEFQGNQSGNAYAPQGLVNDTTYFWRVDEVNAQGTTEGAVWSFTTQAASSGNGPSLLDVAATALTGSSAIIQWTTDHSSDSTVEYGMSSLNYGLVEQSGALVTAHAATLPFLQAGTRYFYRVRSRNAAGDETVSQEYSFVTPISEGVGLRLGWQGDPKTTMSVIWHSPDLLPTIPRTYVGTVQYGLTSAYELGSVTGTDQHTPDLDVWHHKVEMTGLLPGTEYHYRVGDPAAGGWWSVDHSFRTAPAAGPSAFAFSIFADQSVEQAAWDVMGTLLGQEPDLHILAGDISYAKSSDWGVWSSWENMVEPQASRIPYLLARGDNDPTYFYDRLFMLPDNETAGERWYSIDYANTHLVALATGGDCGIDRDPSEAAWLAADLAGASSDPDIDWIMVYSSCPPFSINAYHGSDLKLRQAYGPLFEQYGVDLVFGADDHNYQRTYPVMIDETVVDSHADTYLDATAPIYMVIGTGGGVLNDNGWSSVPAWNAQGVLSHGFTLVSVDGLNVQVRFLDIQGRELDSFSLVKSN